MGIKLQYQISQERKYIL